MAAVASELAIDEKKIDHSAVEQPAVGESSSGQDTEMEKMLRAVKQSTSESESLGSTALNDRPTVEFYLADSNLPYDKYVVLC
jgi:hypothetical protein